MQSNFTILFSLQVKHTYFVNGVCNCLEFTPAADTDSILKRFGFITKQQPAGFALYASSGSSITSLLGYIQQVTGQDAFVFNIATANPLFALFTELPVNDLGCLLYNSSSPNNTAIADGLQLAATQTAATCTTGFGCITICFADILKAFDEKKVVSFTILYYARSTQWQYYIINKSAVRMDNPSITGKDSIAFTGPDKVMLENGEPALLFSSGNTLLPLSNVPKYVFGLANAPIIINGGGVKKTGVAQTVFKGLPNPDPSRVGTVIIDGGSKVSSPMYVYI